MTSKSQSKPGNKKIYDKVDNQFSVKYKNKTH